MNFFFLEYSIISIPDKHSHCWFLLIFFVNVCVCTIIFMCRNIPVFFSLHLFTLITPVHSVWTIIFGQFLNPFSFFFNFFFFLKKHCCLGIFRLSSTKWSICDLWMQRIKSWNCPKFKWSSFKDFFLLRFQWSWILQKQNLNLIGWIIFFCSKNRFEFEWFMNRRPK